MRVRTVVVGAVSGMFLLSVSGVFGAESSSTSSIPTLEILSIEPASPATLRAGEKVIVKVRYDMADCESVQIWVRSSSSSRDELSHPCSPIPRSYGRTGYMEGWLYFDDKALVKEIKVVMKDVAKNAFVYETTKTVDYQWTAAPVLKAPEKLEGTTRIPGSFTWDIDSGTIGGNSKLVDLWFQVDANRELSLVARNNASMAILVIPFDKISLVAIKRCFNDPRLGQKEISNSKGRYRLQPGLCFGLKTSEGRIAKLELLEDEFPKCLVFRWQIYPDAVRGESEPPKPIKTDSTKQYEGLWVYTDPWGQADDRIVALEGWFEKGGKLAFDLVKHSCVSKPLFSEAIVRKDQIEIRFNDVQYAGQNSSGKTMSFSLLYHEDQLLGQVFRDGWEPKKVVMRRPDFAMANQIITGLAREKRDVQSRLEREQTQAASEKLALKNTLELLEKTSGQLRLENSELSVSLNRAKKETEDMAASWDRAKEQIAELQKELAQARQANRELSDHKQQVLKTVQALEDMLRQSNETKRD